MRVDNLFITGMPRSGTTLLDKLLTFKNVSHVYSQPLPLLFSAIKEIFLRRLDLRSPYPLSDMMLSNFYDSDMWLKFLASFCINQDLYEEVAASMKHFPGQYTPSLDSRTIFSDEETLPLAKFLRVYLDKLGSEPSKMIGLKETWCEEYIKYLSRSGFKCLLIIRDPRDVVCSLSYGRGREYGGRPKPLLYNLRAWRKSVAIRMFMEKDPMFMSIRYEELVEAPKVTLDKVLSFLAIDGLDSDLVIEEIKDQSGKTWQSNSSYGVLEKVSNTSVGRYRQYLSDDTVRFIEACCFPEMHAMGYHCDVGYVELTEVLENFSENGVLERPELAGYLWSSDRAREEIGRLSMLQEKKYQPSYFLHKEAFQKLCSLDLRSSSPDHEN